MVRRHLEDLQRLVGGIRAQLERPDTLGLDSLEDLTRTLHGVFQTLMDLLPGLNALSLERMSEDGEAQLEATSLEFRKVRGAVMAALGVLGPQAVSALETGPGLFTTLDHAPVMPERTRFEGDWALPVGATLRAI